jgi:hypothetical protein
MMALSTSCTLTDSGTLLSSSEGLLRAEVLQELVGHVRQECVCAMRVAHAHVLHRRVRGPSALMPDYVEQPLAVQFTLLATQVSAHASGEVWLALGWASAALQGSEGPGGWCDCCPAAEALVELAAGEARQTMQALQDDVANIVDVAGPLLVRTWACVMH